MKILILLLFLGQPKIDTKIIKKLKLDNYNLSNYRNAINEILYLQNDSVFYKNYFKNIQYAKKIKRYKDDRVDFSIIELIRVQQFHSSLLKYEKDNSILIPEKLKQPLLWSLQKNTKLTEMQIKNFLIEEYIEVPVFESVFYTLILYDENLLYLTINKYKLDKYLKLFLDNPYPLCDRDIPFNLRERMKIEMINLLKNSKDEYSKKIIQSFNDFEME